MLSFLERLVVGVWDTLRRIVSLIVPFVSEGRHLRQWGQGIKWALRIILLVGLFVGLWWVNRYFELDRLISPPILRRFHLEKFWLPILAGLLLVLAWLGWWLWKLLGPEEEQADFA